MAKQTGIGSQIKIKTSGGASTDISNDITTFTLTTSKGVQDVTGIDKSAMERLGLLQDAKIEISGLVNTAGSYLVFKDVTSSSVAREVIVNYPLALTGAPGATAPTLTFTALFTDFALSRNQNGELTFKSSGELSVGTAPVWTTQ